MKSGCLISGTHRSWEKSLSWRHNLQQLNWHDAAVHHLAACTHIMKLNPVGKLFSGCIQQMGTTCQQSALAFLSLKTGIVVVMLWQAVSCSLVFLWSVGFLQTLVGGSSKPPIVGAGWKENRHQSLWLSVCRSSRTHGETAGISTGNFLTSSSLISWVCTYIYSRPHVFL